MRDDSASAVGCGAGSTSLTLTRPNANRAGSGARRIYARCTPQRASGVGAGWETANRSGGSPVDMFEQGSPTRAVERSPARELDIRTR
jgi:hypothetical protein